MERVERVVGLRGWGGLMECVSLELPGKGGRWVGDGGGEEEWRWVIEVDGVG